MSSGASAFRAGRLWLAIAAGLVLVLLAVRGSIYFRTPFLEQGDLAANALQIHHAKHFAELHGNYSRFEINHPGPAFFYVYAAGEWLLHDVLRVVPSPGNAHLLAAAALQGGFFAGTLVLLAARVRRRSFVPVALIAAAAYFGRLSDPLTSVWAPHALPLPFAFFLAAATSVALGELRHLTWLVLAGGFLVHGHVAQLLFVGGVGALALVLGARAMRGSSVSGLADVMREHRRTLIASAALAAIFLLPLAIDLVTRGARSNVAAILGRFSANTSGHVSILQSLLFFIAYPVSSRAQDLLFTTPGPETWVFLQGKAFAIVAWLGVLVLPTLVAWRRRDRLDPDERRFFLTAGAMLAAAVICALVWGTAQAGGVKNFNGYVFHGIYFFAMLPGVALASRATEPRWSRPATLIASALAMAMAGYALRARPMPAAEQGLAIQQGVAAMLTANRDARPKLLVFASDDWHLGAAVGLELTRRGVAFYVPPWWSYVFQPRHDRARAGGGENPEHFDVWWLGATSASGGDGVPIARERALFRVPPPLDPQRGVIRFDRGGGGMRQVVSGFTDAAEPGLALSNEPRAWLRFVPATAARSVRLIFDVQAAREGEEAVADVFCNGVTLGRVAARGVRSEVAVSIPPEIWNRASPATLELRFVAAEPDRSAARPDYEAWQAWRLWSIRCESP